jgi:hypothetical protein
MEWMAETRERRADPLVLKKSEGLAAFCIIQANKRSRQIAMPGKLLGTTVSRARKNDVSESSSFIPVCISSKARTRLMSGVSLNPCTARMTYTLPPSSLTVSRSSSLT